MKDNFPLSWFCVLCWTLFQYVDMKGIAERDGSQESTLIVYVCMYDYGICKGKEEEYHWHGNILIYDF